MKRKSKENAKIMEKNIFFIFDEWYLSDVPRNLFSYIKTKKYQLNGVLINLKYLFLASFCHS